MRFIAAGLGSAILLAGCTGGGGTATLDPRPVTPSVEPEPTVTPVALAPAPSPTPAPPPTPTVEPLDNAPGFDALKPFAVTTATGVTVAVIAEVPAGLVVRSPCGRSATISGGEPLGPVDVVLDPGHGGPNDTGAVGPNGLVERDLNLDVALATEAELVARDIGVALTRNADYPTILPTRAQLADAVRARALVSIHHNAPLAPASETPGTEIFVQSTSRKSRRLGGVIFEHLVEGLATLDGVQWQAAEDAGVLEVLNTGGTDAYGMVRRPSTPSVLVEIGYIANPSEAELMATEEYVEVAAQSLADGIEEFLSSGGLGAGYVAEPRVFDPAAAPGGALCEDPVLE